MRYASLFSGAGGFDLGFDRAGLECRFQCEIDPQASKVLFRHWPGVPKHTDVRLVGKKHLPAVDVVVGGFPCQDLSVAGKREGLKGERSGLYYELLRVVGLCRPRFVVWENVPGLLSSDDGRDFGRVLRGLADIGYFGAWRVLDARFFGVPQRRRRVFGVFARGRAGAVRSAEVLALAAGVRGDSAAGGEAGEDVAFTLTSSVGRNSGGTRVGNDWNTNYVAGTLTGGRAKGGYNQRDEAGLVVAETLRASAGRRNGQPAKGWEEGHLVETFTELGEGHSTYRPTDEANSLRTNAGGGSQVANLVARCLTASNQRNDGETDNFVCVTGDHTHALTAVGADASEDGTGRGTPLVAFSAKDYGADVGELSPTIRAGGHHRSHANGGVMPAFAGAMGVRRLTPRECERLMSWPDDWTRWDADGNEFADGPRYRMAGNGVVSNVAEWIARRLIKYGQ